ncbi:hypothetical protein [Belliella pelovolcani]|uniref:Uncharacterized protein n=1 Tax=Belliella pelovolcani TaxID=529505 RepID=A0A1N7MRI3_9BACT|nr:hypothetical protein [Belliella pelovolcani]SIS88551.1 hypothetical protein SAMN05421761_10756 [Belliella pelovolcani]
MVEYFKITEEKSIPVRINRRVLTLIEKKAGKGLSTLNDMSTQQLTDMVFLGHLEAVRFLNEKSEYTNQEDFENYIDDNINLATFIDESTRIISVFFQGVMKT